MFTEEELKMIRFALEHLHDCDLSNFNEEDIKALETVMNKFNIKYTSIL